MTGATGNYVPLNTDRHPVHIWWDERNRCIHLTCTNPELTDEANAKPGFRVVFNASPRSADYSPGNFNRLARYLRSYGKPAPDEVPLHSRKLSDRPGVIAELTGEPSRRVGQPADPATLGWAVCETCAAVVVDVDRHRANACG